MKSPDVRLPDDVWQVIKDHMLTYKTRNVPDELREILEQVANIELFDGGAFVSIGNEFDLFVVPEKRGRWHPVNDWAISRSDGSTTRLHHREDR
mgnify:CR=1 FL=1